MCVTVRTLCLLVSSVSVILSVARAVIHDMLHLMVHQGCDPFINHSAVSQNGHDVGASSRYTRRSKRERDNSRFFSSADPAHTTEKQRHKMTDHPQYSYQRY